MLAAVEISEECLFFADVGDGDFVEEVFPEHGDLLLGGEVAALLVHG